VKTCLKDESIARQRAEEALKEHERALSAQAQAVEEAEAKSAMMASAVSQWQVRERGREGGRGA
jgi:F0F1-type ATP synthase epsilon subunit